MNRARGRGAAPRATARRGAHRRYRSRHLVFGAVGLRPDARGGVAVAGMDGHHLAAVTPFCGFYLQRPIARLNAQSSCQRESRWRIMNADSVPCESSVLSPCASRLSGANLHSALAPPRTRTRAVPVAALDLDTHAMVALPAASLVAARVRARTSRPARGSVAHAPASRARDPPTRRAARRPPASRSAPRRPRSGRRLEPRARRRGVRGRGRRRRQAPRAARACRGSRVPGREGWGGRRGRRLNPPPPPSLRFKNYQKNLTIEAAKRKRRNPPKPEPVSHAVDRAAGERVKGGGSVSIDARVRSPRSRARGEAKRKAKRKSKDASFGAVESRKEP